MGDLVSRTIKLKPERDEQLIHEAAFHDVNCTDMVKACMRIGFPLLRQVPGLLEADERRISELMTKVGKIVVILDKE